jgi:hypothetical protein
MRFIEFLLGGVAAVFVAAGETTTVDADTATGIP